MASDRRRCKCNAAADTTSGAAKLPRSCTTPFPCRGGRSRVQREHSWNGVSLMISAASVFIAMPAQPASAKAIYADAYTVGNDVLFADGKYVPGTSAGRRLIAHELAHVLQQEASSFRSIQRAITLTDAGSAMPHAPGAVGPFPTKAFTLNNWLDTLCPGGNWNVNAGTGAVESPDRATFCGARPARGAPHHTTSAHPTSCRCLCELTAPGATNVQVQIDDNITVGGTSTPLAPLGEAATAFTNPRISGFTGREHTGLRGAGATAPIAGAGRTQTIPDPPWIIFGHEVCGHARLETAVPGATDVSHSTTPQGNETTVDIENRIRREHSTPAASLGIRAARFNARDAAGNFGRHWGSAYDVGAGETLAGIAARCGIATANMLDHIWRLNGARITVADQDRLAANERLLIEGIDWHQVIGGETMSSIARIWDIPLASLQRANPQVTGPDFVVRTGDRLLIPAS